ncbi:MAG: efflux RND transporter periplasmic adaptor subunit [Halocynthiibacter sp.]
MNEFPSDFQVKSLDFSDERGATRSGWMASGLVVALLLWMGSGIVFPADTPEETPKEITTPSLVNVVITHSTASPVTQFFVAEGQALPDRTTHILSEMGGHVIAVLAEKGTMVQAGQPIARFDTRERTARLKSARHTQEQAKKKYQNAKHLLTRGSATQDAVAAAKANLTAATAHVLAAQQAADAGTILAPFSGRLETFALETGKYVPPDSNIAHLVDNDPLTIAIQVPQHAVRSLSQGLTADITFITGEKRTGVMSFLASNANPQTRTFLAEISVENPSGDIPAGVSVEVRIPTGQQEAHFISSGILSISSDGVLKVKTVDDKNTVVAFPVNIIRAQRDGIWVSGLPKSVRVISIGQGFVTQGEIVNPHTQHDTKGGRVE